MKRRSSTRLARPALPFSGRWFAEIPFVLFVVHRCLEAISREAAINTQSAEIVALGLLISCEETLGQLYGEFAAQPGALQDFWREMAAEEHLHAIWLRNLVSSLEQQALGFRENRFQPEQFHLFRQYLQERLREAHAHLPSDFAALTLAVDCEGTIVERNFFEVLEGDTAEMRSTLTALETATVKHQQRVKAMWDRYNPSRREI